VSKYKRIDISRVKTIKTVDRPTKSDLSGFGKAYDPSQPFDEFLKSLPDFLKSSDLLKFAGRMAKAKIDNKAVIWMMGAHPIKVGLSPVLIDLIENGFISHLVFNGACMIHDLEIAFFGRTSEDVADGLADGKFGMVEETPQMIFEAAENGIKDNLGLGETAGKYIEDKKAANKEFSLLYNCYKNNTPVSVHLAFGTDTISQHPGFNGAVMGELTHNDFLMFAESLKKISHGAVINCGSAVILPELFLKALTVARNIYGQTDNFYAANFDMIQHYRPNVNVVTRPVAESGQGFSFTGHHEIMIPLLAAAIKIKYNELKENL